MPPTTTVRARSWGHDSGVSVANARAVRRGRRVVMTGAPHSSGEMAPQARLMRIGASQEIQQIVPQAFERRILGVARRLLIGKFSTARAVWMP